MLVCRFCPGCNLSIIVWRKRTDNIQELSERRIEGVKGPSLFAYLHLTQRFGKTKNTTIGYFSSTQISSSESHNYPKY